MTFFPSQLTSSIAGHMTAGRCMHTPQCAPAAGPVPSRTLLIARRPLLRKQFPRSQERNRAVYAKWRSVPGLAEQFRRERLRREMIDEIIAAAPAAGIIRSLCNIGAGYRAPGWRERSS